MKGGVVWIVSLDLELDEQFRDTISKLNGGKYHRGDLKTAMVEAIEDWIGKKRQAIK